MDGHAAVLESNRWQRGALPDSSVAPILSCDGYDVKPMNLTWPKLLFIWEQLSRFRTLFSDLTKGDLENFIRYITSQDTLWLEIWKGDNLVGIITCEGMHRIIDIEAHVLFLDREVANKAGVCKEVVKWLFDNFALQRITVEVPRLYFATIRLVEQIGFRYEGTKRDAILIGGKWENVKTFGLTRREATLS